MNNTKTFIQEYSTKGLGVFFSLIGVLLILTKGNLLKIFVMQYNKGDLLILAAIIMWTLYSIIGKKLASIPTITSTAVSGLFAEFILVPLLGGLLVILGVFLTTVMFEKIISKKF